MHYLKLSNLSKKLSVLTNVLNCRWIGHLPQYPQMGQATAGRFSPREIEVSGEGMTKFMRREEVGYRVMYDYVLAKPALATLEMKLAMLQYVFVVRTYRRRQGVREEISFMNRKEFFHYRSWSLLER